MGSPPELLLPHDPDVVADARDDRRGIEVPRALEFGAADVDDRARVSRVGDEFGDALPLHVVAERPQLGVRKGPVADLRGPGALGHGRHDVAVHPLGHIKALDGDADLPVVHERALEQSLRDLTRVHVVEHDCRIVAAELEGNPLQVGRRCDVDGRAGRDRAGERDLPWHRVSRDHSPQLVPAADHVQHPRGQQIGDSSPARSELSGV